MARRILILRNPAGGACSSQGPGAGSSVAVSISPGVATIAPGAAQAFTASVSGAANAAVTWSVQEGSAGGAVDGSGHYTAPAAPGRTTWSRPQRQEPTEERHRDGVRRHLHAHPRRRLTVWNPGIPGGVPSRTTQCGATVAAAAYGNGSAEPPRESRRRSMPAPRARSSGSRAGTFKVTRAINISKGIVLRGAGPSETKLLMTPAGASAT